MELQRLYLMLIIFVIMLQKKTTKITRRGAMGDHVTVEGSAIL